jgi:plasmid stability protein
VAQVIIRNLDEATVAALKARAAAKGHSLEKELRRLLTEAAQPTREAVADDAAEIRRLGNRVDVDLEALIREDRPR